MNYQKTLELMRSLRLIGMADRYNAIMETPIHQRPDAVVILAQLVEAEDLYRNNRRMLSAIKNARFRYQASLNDVIYSDQRNITREIITSMADCKGKRVAYFSLPKLLSKLKTDKLDGSFRKEMDRIENKNLLILDDWGLTPLDTAARLALLQIIEDRHSRYSTILTSQLPISAWHQYINENTVADAILDRIIHQAHRIELKGESLRKTTKIYVG